MAAEVAQLAGQGVREVNLLGQNVNAYRGRMHDGEIADLALLIRYVAAIDGIERLYDGPYLHEVALRFDRPVGPMLERLAAQGILAGYDLTEYAGTDALLVCATETKSDADIDRCIAAVAEVMNG
mgnify:CR=1 FL=1